MAKLIPVESRGLIDDDDLGLLPFTWQGTSEIHLTPTAASDTVPQPATVPVPDHSSPSQGVDAAPNLLAQGLDAAPNVAGANPQPSTTFFGPLPGPAPFDNSNHSSAIPSPGAAAADSGPNPSTWVTPQPPPPTTPLTPDVAGHNIQEFIRPSAPLSPTAPDDSSLGGHHAAHPDWLI